MINEDKKRNYEVSIWTLQDSFITILKSLNLEYKGTIIEPLMTLKDDGEYKFSFKIPMYIQDEKGNFIENPIWHNTNDGTILIDLRKIKVIFNKKTEDEDIFEFLITNIKESHDKWQKYCEVECEGLAFHELGRQGYKITLDGLTEIEQEQKKWFENPATSGYTSCPKGNLNYWADKIFKNSNWRYSVQMDYSNEDGVTHQIYERTFETLDSNNYENFTEEQKEAFNTWREQILGLRRRDRIYENTHATGWKLSDDKNELYPLNIEDGYEKYRMIESKESNRYNLSQTIAEIFQVYCKYKYYYDDNYHIIDREAIFYNNFLNESQEVIDLTYKYNTEHLTRTMDSSDLVTKMFVKSINDSSMPSGEVSISDTDANKSLEDYILNFDYMYKIGTISEEQYERIEPYQLELREINEKYNEASNNFYNYSNQIIEQESRLDGAKSFRNQDIEGLSNAEALKINLVEVAGKIDYTNPQMLSLIPKSGETTYYCNFKTQGIKENTIELYREYNYTSHQINLNSKISQYNLVKDEYGNITGVENINISGENFTIYAVFEYDPQHHINNIINLFKIRLSKDEKIIADAEKKLKGDENNKGLYTLKEEAEEEKDTLLERKNKIIAEFENFMGPALREGKWQPEDEYSGYGDVHDDECILTPISTFSNNLVSIGWDEELFDDEQSINFDYGLVEDTYSYPCIKITPNLLKKYTFNELIEKLTFIYSTDISKEDDYTNIIQKEQGKKQYLSINSKMIFGFIKNTGYNQNHSAIPVLILLEAQKISDDYLWQLEKGYLAIVSLDGTGKLTESSIMGGVDLEWIIKPTNMSRFNNYKTIFPRFQINSNTLKSYNTNISIKTGEAEGNGQVWQNYQDFYILSRSTSYYITLKPHVILKELLNFNTENYDITYSIHYIISVSAIAIYLDALEVLKENSYPKVSYEIDVISANKEFIYKTYKCLGQIAHINDYEFKFKNTLGYISEVDLDLDRPWQDKIIIKNYKTKFEDLFSTIVAQTEEMKKNSSAIGLASNAFQSDGTLNNFIVEDLANRLPFFTVEDEKIITPEIEYSKYEPYIRELLRESYYEAGQILSKAQESVSELNELNIKNSDILTLFKEDVKNNMTPINFVDDIEGKRHNIELDNYSTSFKKGDIWQRNNGNVYLATSDSSAINFEEENESRDVEKALLTSLKGWSLTKDGSLAQIKGASLDINSDAGKIEILAKNEINIGVNGLLKLAGEDVKIIGNKTVEIGGTDIKIYSAYQYGSEIIGKDGDGDKGIHIYTSVYDANPEIDNNSSSAIDITGKGIVMRAAEGIKMNSGKGIDFFVSDEGDDVAAISISGENGIFLGSTKQIVLYAEDDYDFSKASVRINSNEILFGISNGAYGNALKITQDYFTIGSAPTIKDENKIPYIGTENISFNSSTSGIYIDRYTIRLATGENVNNRSIISMDEEGLTIAHNNCQNTGAIISLSSDNIIVGTAAKENDFITDIVDVNSSHNIGTYYNGAKFQVYAPNFVVNEAGNLFAFNAYISGEIQSSSGKIGGWVINSNYLSLENADVGMSALNNQGLSAFWAGGNDGTFSVTHNGVLSATSANIEGEITASSGSFIGTIYTDGGCFTTNPNRTFSDDRTHAGVTMDNSGIGGSNGNSGVDNNYFYLSTNGSLETNNISITGGELNLGNGVFYVNNDGYVNASNIEITGGSLNIQNKNTGITFEVNNDGSVTASNINITGGNFSMGEGIFSVSNEGYMIAKNGQIGNWFLSSNHIGNDPSKEASTVGLSATDSGFAFWSGGNNVDYNSITEDLSIILNDEGEGETTGDWGVWSANMPGGSQSFAVNSSGTLYANKAFLYNTVIKDVLINGNIAVDTTNIVFTGDYVKLRSTKAEGKNSATMAMGSSLRLRSYDSKGNEAFIIMNGTNIAIKGNVSFRVLPQYNSSKLATQNWVENNSQLSETVKKINNDYITSSTQSLTYYYTKSEIDNLLANKADKSN